MNRISVALSSLLMINTVDTFVYAYILKRYQYIMQINLISFFFQAEDGIRDYKVTWSSDVCSSDLRSAAIWFSVSILLYIMFYKWIDRLFQAKPALTGKLFYSALTVFVLFAMIIIVTASRSLMTLFWAVLLLHLVYVIYIHLRRVEPKAPVADHRAKNFFTRGMYRLMEVLHIPVKEFGYFLSFNIVAVLGLIIYLLSIFNMDVAWNVGPFPFVLLAFAVLGGFGNLITAASVRINVNLHLIILLLAIFLPTKETHLVRTFDITNQQAMGAFKKRQDINEYFRNWVNQ